MDPDSSAAAGRNDRRFSSRIALSVPVECRPLRREGTDEVHIELRTEDVHSGGARLCGSVSEELFEEAYRKGDWFEVEGLSRVVGWEGEKKVFGKVVWFRSGEFGKVFQAGIKFHRGLPPVDPSAVLRQAERAKDCPSLSVPIPKISEKDLKLMRFELLSRRRLAECGLEKELAAAPAVALGGFDFEAFRRRVAVGEKRVLIVDEDRSSWPDIFLLAGRHGFSGFHGASFAEGLELAREHKPQIIFLNPVFSGAVPGGGSGILDLDGIENLRRQDAGTFVVLMVPEEEAQRVLAHPKAGLANWLFTKPVDLVRLKELMDRVCSGA